MTLPGFGGDEIKSYRRQVRRIWIFVTSLCFIHWLVCTLL